MKHLFKNDKYEFLLIKSKNIFQCRKCHKTGSGNHVIRKEVGNTSEFANHASYHTDCVASIIQDLRDNLQLNEVKTLDNIAIGKPKPPKTEPPKQPISETSPKPKRKGPKLFEGIDKPKAPVIDNRPKALISLKNNRIYIKAPYNEKLIQRFNFLGDIKFNREFKLWECRIEFADYETCRAILTLYKRFTEYHWRIEKNAFKVVKERLETHKEHIEQRKALTKLKNAKNAEIVFENLKKQPFNYQKVGINFLNAIGGVGYIGDDMGLGKTLQFLGYTSQFKWKVAVVCPASLKYNWRNEILKFTHKKPVVITEYKPSELDAKTIKGDYFIVNYEQLGKYEKFLKKMKFKCVGVDEAQYIKTFSSIRSRMVRKLFRKVPHKILMSGTPIKNRPIEFYSQLNFLRPDLFKNKHKYGLRYCDGKRGLYGYDYSGSTNISELKRKISPFYIRRIKEEVLTELPKKTVSVLDLELSQSERKEYETLLFGIEELDKINRDLTGELSANNKMRQLGDVERLSRFCSMKKIPKVIEFVKKAIDENSKRKVVVFSRWIESQKELENRVKALGVGYATLFGEDSAEKRQQAIDEFQNNKDCRVFVLSTLAGGVGINLTEADTVIFTDFMWSPADHQQATDRVHRLGQDNPVFIYYMKFMETIEEQIWSVIGDKLQVVEEVLRDDTKKEDKVDNLERIYNKIIRKKT